MRRKALKDLKPEMLIETDRLDIGSRHRQCHRLATSPSQRLQRMPQHLVTQSLAAYCRGGTKLRDVPNAWTHDTGETESAELPRQRIRNRRAPLWLRYWSLMCESMCWR